MASYLRGLQRGVGADFLGGPVDLTTELLNAGIGGANLLGANLPKIEKPVGGSDWFADRMMSSDDGTPQFLAGRLTPLAATLTNAAGGGAKRLVNALVSRSAPSRSGAPSTLIRQEGAIRPGGRSDLMPSHDTKLENLEKVVGPQGALELSNPSLAITKGAVPSSFSGGSAGSVQLIPRPGAFDPATSPTTLLNRDAYTARWQQFGSQPVGKSATYTPLSEKYLNTSTMLKDYREGKLTFKNAKLMGQPYTHDGHLKESFDTLADRAASDPDYMKELARWHAGLELRRPELEASELFQSDARHFNRVQHFKSLIELPSGGVANSREAAAARIKDRLFSPAVGKAAAGREGGGAITTGDMLPRVRFDGGITGRLSQDLAIKASPSFRSFSEYERSPKGARLLTDKAETPDYPRFQAKTVEDAFRKNNAGWIHTSTDDEEDIIMLTEAALQAKVRGRRPAGIEQAMESVASSRDIPDDIVENLMWGRHSQDFKNILEDVHRAYANSPAPYAELKAHGQVPVNAENFAGVVLRRPFADWSGRTPSLPENQQAIIRALVDRNVPVVSTLRFGDDEAAFYLADALQRQAGPARKTPLR